MKPLWILAVLLGSLEPVSGGAPGDSLGRAIPEDYFFYLRRRANPEREFLRAPLTALGQAVDEAKLCEGLVEAIAGRLSPSGKAAALEEAIQWRRVLESVPWRKLTAREWALGARFSITWESVPSLQKEIRLDWIALFRVDPRERDGHLGAIRKVVLAFATLGEGLEVIDTEREGVPTTLLISGDGEAKLCVGGRGEVIAASSSAREMRRALKLLGDEGRGRGLVEGQEFARLMAALPPSEDGEILFRPGLVFRQLRLAAKAVEEARVLPALAEVQGDLAQAVEAIVETFDLVHAVAVSETTDGRRLRASYRVELTEEEPQRSLHGAFADREALGDPARLVPRDAVGFTVTSGANLERLHDAGLKFVEKASDAGSGILEKYRRTQERAGFDLKKDLLSLIEGRAVIVSFPPPKATQPGGKTPAGASSAGTPAGASSEASLRGARRAGGDWVALLRLRDPAAVQAKLRDWLEARAEGLRALGMGPVRVELPGVPGDFYRLALPFPPGLEVTVGVSGDEFAAGTSRERIQESFLVRSAKVPSVLENPNFQGVELSPRGEVHTVAYRDLGELFVKVERGIAGAGTLGVLIPDLPDGEEPLTRKLLSLASRLGPVARSLGFLDQAALYLARDGKALFGEVVVTTRPIPAVSPAESPPVGERPPATKRRTF